MPHGLPLPGESAAEKLSKLLKRTEQLDRYARSTTFLDWQRGGREASGGDLEGQDAVDWYVLLSSSLACTDTCKAHGF